MISFSPNTRIKSAEVNANFNEVYVTPWTDWVPSYTCSGTMTIGTITTHYARYCQFGKTVFYNLYLTATLSGGAWDYLVYFTIPVAPVAADAGWPAIGQASYQENGLGWADANTMFATAKGAFAHSAGTQWTLGTATKFTTQGFYEAA